MNRFEGRPVIPEEDRNDQSYKNCDKDDRPENGFDEIVRLVFWQFRHSIAQRTTDVANLEDIWIRLLYVDGRALSFTRRRLALALIGAVSVATACSGGKTPESPAAGAPSIAGARSASIEETVAHTTLDELPHLREEITLETWKKLHATDSLELYSPKLASYPNGNWCARVVSEAPLDSERRVKKTAYFYLPPAPQPLALPPNLGQEELVSQCRLGFVWSEVEDTDFARAEALAEVLREPIKRELGPGEVDIKLNWPGSSNWPKTALWENGRLEVVSALGVTSRSPATVVGAAAEISGFRFRRVVDFRKVAGARENHVAQHQPIWSRIEETLSIARLGGPDETSFRAALKLVTASDAWWSRLPSASEQSTIFDAVDRWLIASGSLPAARRSAALFAADQLFQESQGPRWHHDENPVIRQRLEAQGANFVWLELGGSYFYTHTWLREALRLDPDGRAGELAFLTLTEMGFETSGHCTDQHGEGFREVIAQGQEYIRRRPGSAIEPDLHFLMAQAYGDIVALASGSAYTESESNEYRPEAASARTRAIEQFRIAFDSADNTPRAREAWPDAWRLIAGFPPGKIHFYCIYD